MLLDQLAVALTMGATYSLIAIGFSLTYRTMGLLNFTIPELMMAGAMFGFSRAMQTKLKEPGVNSCALRAIGFQMSGRSAASTFIA